MDDSRPEMTAEEFCLLRDLVYERSGILVRDDMKYLMERRLWPRVEAMGLADFDSYYRHLRYDVQRQAELELAIEALTINETYFFREPLQLRAFAEELLPRLRRANEPLRTLRVWSAGCSTGEEAYTVAMLLQDSGLFAGWEMEVYGTDISRRVLEAARRAEYGASALRVAPPEYVARHFEPAGARMRVKPDIRAMVFFGQLNLLELEAGHFISQVDVIFCRNVMIYFDQVARRRVLEGLYAKLVEGGYLLLGASESLLNLSTDFELVHLKEDLIYRRPLPAGCEGED